jgi:hypothetical protein
MKRDLRAMRRAGELDRAHAAVDDLETEADGLDIVAIQGRAPYRRLRTGNWRLLFRPLTPDEMRDLGHRGRGYLVARIVNRRDLDEAVAGL